MSSVPPPPEPETWESLAPWEKAREWKDAYPEIADEIVRMGKQRAQQVWQLEQERAEHQRRLDQEQLEHQRRLDQEQLEHQRRLDAEASRRSWAESEHQRLLEERRALHVAEMEKRLWLLQLISLLGSLGGISLQSVIAYIYASSGNVLPGLALLVAGGAVTAGAYVTGRRTSRELQQSIEGSASGSPNPATKPANN